MRSYVRLRRRRKPVREMYTPAWFDSAGIWYVFPQCATSLIRAKPDYFGLWQRSAGDHSPDAFDLTTKVLDLNPEFYTIWNYRREIMLNSYLQG